MRKILKQAVSAVLCMALLFGAVPANGAAKAAGENKAFAVPVSYSGLSFDNGDPNTETTYAHTSISPVAFGTSGNTISYKIYAPKEMFNLSDGQWREIHCDITIDLDGENFEGCSMRPKYWMNIETEDGKLVPRYHDSTLPPNDDEWWTTPDKEYAAITEVGKYVLIDVKDFPLRDEVCVWSDDEEHWSPITDTIKDAEWMSVCFDFAMEEVTYTGIMYLDDVVFGVDGKEVRTIDYNSLDGIDEMRYAVHNPEIDENWIHNAQPSVLDTENTEALALAKDSGTVVVGKTIAISAKAVPEAEITYTSANPQIAAVDSNGIVTGVKRGTTTIEVTANKITKQFTVTVKGYLTIPKTKASVKVGKKFNIKAKGSAKITYKSSKTKICTVSAKGVVTAKKKGKAVITVKCDGITKKVNITVSK